VLGQVGKTAETHEMITMGLDSGSQCGGIREKSRVDPITKYYWFKVYKISKRRQGRKKFKFEGKREKNRKSII